MTKDAYLGELFEISTGLLIQYEDKGVYVIQNKDRWRQGDSGITAGIVGVGGKLEQGESITDCVKRECLEELKVPVTLTSANKTLLFENGKIRQIEFNSPDVNPAYVLVLPKTEPGRKPYTLVFVYQGTIAEKPQPDDVSAVVYISDSELKKAFEGDMSTLEKVIESGADVDSSEEPPKDLRLKAFGTVKAHLEYLHQS